MKIGCRCGEDISDTTDFISYKATVIADQDREDFFDAIVTGVERRLAQHGAGKRKIGDVVFVAVSEALRSYERSAYVCGTCRRLWLQNRGDDLDHYRSFVPEEVTGANDALRSKLKSRWRGFIRAHWGIGAMSARGGSIAWECGDGESGLEELSTWEQLESRYHDLLATLRGRDVLRSALLKKDGEAVHVWPPAL